MDKSAETETSASLRLQLLVNGVVQGVGFRPFVYRIATELMLAGSVQNGPRGVTIEIEGQPEAIHSFQQRLKSELPPQARIDSLEVLSIAPIGGHLFQIILSSHDGNAATLIPPDIATCDECLREMFDVNDRRYRYPFINCTNCGPRYTIVHSVPYDRPFTSMASFTMCPACQREYDDPADRRFHAQPNACPVCGPQVALRDIHGSIAIGDPIAKTVALLKEGKIVAIRGVGGFHLTVDATNESAVVRLRQRKGRAEKPLALMAPDIASIGTYCAISDQQRNLLLSPQRPIVLLGRKAAGNLAPSVAPDQKYLGFMLPYTPLHHLLLRGNFKALVMTSGNLSEEPIAIGNEEATRRLRGIADYFLLHDREIRQRCDDSIARAQADELRIIRRARGYVPLPVSLPHPTSVPILAVGAELKNTVALSRGSEVFLSQHIGDLDNPSALGFFEECIAHLEQTLDVMPEVIAYDLHPEYLSTQWANRQKLPSISVQHHHAHLASVLAENRYAEKAIGIILDGTGFGTDGTIWGGELLYGDATEFNRSAWLEPVPMPGGALAIRHPWRMAVGFLYQTYGESLPELNLPLIAGHRSELPLLIQMIHKKINSPLTSSCGRLFDAVAAMLGFDREVAYEAQAAIELEMLCDQEAVRKSNGFAASAPTTLAGGAIEISSLITGVVEAVLSDQPREKIAADFHRTIIELWVQAAIAERKRTGCNTVALSGGVYQNNLIFENMVSRLTEERFAILTHKQVPTNDGGIALGQIAVADAYLRRQRS